MADETVPSAPAPSASAPAPAPARKVGIWTLLVALVIVAILVLYAIAYTVPAGSVAVLKTFGSVTDIVEKNGLHIKAPAPIQSVQLIDKRLRWLEIRNVELMMANQFNVHVVTTIGWRVTDPRKYVTALPNEAMMEDALRACVQDARNAVAQSVKLDDLVSTDPKQRENYSAFEKRYLEMARNNIDPAYGVEITSLYIGGLALPKDATTTVQESMAAQRRAIAEQYKQEGESEAATIKARAESEASRRLADATADAVRIRGRGDAAAAEYYKVYTQSPDAARLAGILKRLEALESAIKPQTLILVTDSTPPFDVLSSGAEKGD